MTRAAIYTRVSSAMQLDGFSLDAQHRACIAYAHTHDLTVVATFTDEGHSARTQQRPAFRQMLDRASEFDVVIVHKLDRFARNVRDLLQVVDQLDAANVRLLSVSDNIDYSNPSGRLQLSIMASVAEWGSRNLADEVRKGHAERAASGLQPTRAPFGYTYDDDGIMQPDSNAATVRRIFDRAAAGDSLNSIADQLNTDGVPTADGKTWRHSGVKYILTNETYTGRVTYNGQTHPGQHPAIVSDALYDAIQQRLNQHTHPRRAAQIYPLSGVLCCSCGSRHPLTGHSVKADGKRYPYYRRAAACPERPRHLPYHRVMTDFERRILPLIAIDDATLAAVAAELSHREPGTITVFEAAAARERLANLYQWGHIDATEYHQRTAEINAAEAPPAPDYTPLTRLLSDFASIYHAATPPQQSELVRLLFNRLFVEEEIVAVEPTVEAWPFLTHCEQKNLTRQSVKLITPEGLTA